MHKKNLRLISNLIFVCLMLYSANIATSQWPGDTETWGPDKDHAVLIKIETVKTILDQGGTPREISYKAMVIYDLTGNLTGHEITAGGTINDLNGLDRAPVLNVGETTMLHISPSKNAESFICEPGLQLPIGLDAGIVIQPADVKDVLEALKLIDMYLPIKDVKKGHEQAVKLLQEKNYFKWSLGVYLLAVEGTKENVELLRQSGADDAITTNQFLWINQMFDSFLSKVAPSCEQRTRDFEDYLKKHSKPMIH